MLSANFRQEMDVRRLDQFSSVNLKSLKGEMDHEKNVRIYFLYFLAFGIMFVPVNLKTGRSAMPPALEQYIKILKSSEKMAAYKAAADLAETSYYHHRAEKIILEFAVKPETPEGTRIFLSGLMLVK
jgi:hypothetical protein